MGVHGLTSFILGSSDAFLKPYELSDCNVVVDGSNIAHTLARGLKSHSVFGGDYDEYYTVVRSFMLALKKCNVYPIVLMDGGCEKRKFQTRLVRRRCMIFKLNFFSQSFSPQQFFPLFLLNVFVSAVRDVGFICVQCDLESDMEIAAVARSLNCPVLSYDSDYFIYDVLYIPFNTVNQTPVKFSYSNKYHMKCSIYDVDDFLKTIGLDKPLLPILATLLGNDYVKNDVFRKFFIHVSIPKTKHKSYTQNRILALVKWLKNEDVNSAVKGILSHLEKKNAMRVSELFHKTIKNYSISTASEAVVNVLANHFEDIHLFTNEFKINWPEEIAKLWADNFIPGFIVNMILYQLCLAPLQVENVNDQSSHFKSLKLIRKIYTMLSPYLTNKNSLKLFLNVRKKYKSIELDFDSSININLDQVLTEPQEIRLQLLCDIVGVSVDDLKIVPCNSWKIFTMSLLYWVKEYKDIVSLAHIHAFIIMMIANQIVQTKVGFYRNSPDFMKRYKEKLATLKDTEITLKESNNFEEMLVNVEHSECLIIQKNLIPLRKTSEEGSGRRYCISTIHLFNCFQSSLYFISVINSLLNHPLPELKVEEFYSGTLLFNLYLCVKSKTSVEKFGSGLFLQTPNLKQIYNYLLGKLSTLSEKTEVKSKKPRKKRSKKNKTIKQEPLEPIHCSTDEEVEFMDENNSYALLCNIKDMHL